MTVINSPWMNRLQIAEVENLIQGRPSTKCYIHKSKQPTKTERLDAIRNNQICDASKSKSKSHWTNWKIHQFEYRQLKVTNFPVTDSVTECELYTLSHRWKYFTVGKARVNKTRKLGNEFKRDRRKWMKVSEAPPTNDLNRWTNSNQ
jgi:hypothetical protein